MHMKRERQIITRIDIYEREGITLNTKSIIGQKYTYMGSSKSYRGVYWHTPFQGCLRFFTNYLDRLRRMAANIHAVTPQYHEDNL